MRTAPTAMLTLALLALVTACGGDTHARAGAASTTHTRGGAHTRSSPLTEGEAVAFARLVALHPADLPGFSESRERQHPETAAQKRAGEALRACIGAPAQKHTHEHAEQGSPKFSREGGLSVESISSSVEVAPSAAAATLELEVVRSAHTRACVSHFLTSIIGQLKAPGASIGRVTLHAFNPSAPGTTGGFGWRVGATISAHGLNLPLRFDLLGFAYRSAVVMLFDVGFPRLAQAQEQRLFALLVARARSFPHEAPVPAAAAQPV